MSSDAVRVRECAQQVISAHLLDVDYELRDRLIEEYSVESDDGELLECVFDFVHLYAVKEVSPQVATDRFRFILGLMGALIEACAGEEQDAIFELTVALCSFDFEEPSNDTHASLRAAQTCLLIHMMVRRGAPPWGVQQNLDLDDMCAVVSLMGDLMWTLLKNAPDWGVGDEVLVPVLLEGVEAILHGMAAHHEASVRELVADYWHQLAATDCGAPPS